MAFANSKQYATDADEEIIPTTTMIKNLPIHWNTGHLLHLMSQMKLPPPRALNYLYDEFDDFRGMAFATFATSEEARQVVLELNYHQVFGRKLNVQYKRKHPWVIAREDFSWRKPLQPTHSSHTNDRYKSYLHPQEKGCPVPRPTRQQTPPSESYNLLMAYQTDPVEKEKLKRILVQTGDYQEAINKFAKNRALESQEVEHPWSMQNRPILEMRPATLGDLQQIAAMESRFGLGGEASLSGLLFTNHEGDRDATDTTKEGY
ncbi:hypothetical protein HO133_002448 [Letharia lupina]|uniref:RRM domain-containing protein n=1 Tax=Letharia lupina TaxID=560253 RepID=A0A8H6CBY6_9LECA|nr:uncharacterized protein HO133_002448 [Letharia lupina]KAF6220768.1 hypothetical protein HO133_002448 [Letharia lupina]